MQANAIFILSNSRDEVCQQVIINKNIVFENTFFVCPPKQEIANGKVAMQRMWVSVLVFAHIFLLLREGYENLGLFGGPKLF